MTDPGRELPAPTEGAAPEWAWPPSPDDLASIASIDVEAFARGDGTGQDLHRSVEVRPWLSSTTSIRPRRLSAIVPLAAAAVVAMGLLAPREPVILPIATSPAAPLADVLSGPQQASMARAEADTSSIARPVTSRAIAAPSRVRSGAAVAIAEPASGTRNGTAAPGVRPVQARAVLDTRALEASPAPPLTPAPTAATMATDAAPPVSDSTRAAYAATVLAGGAVDDAAPASIVPTPIPEARTTIPTDDEPSIRDVLHRYGRAYSRLDASAARAVWPGVDARALERAFAGLRSQQVELGDCRVMLDRAARAASATCSGSQAWVPRVGDASPRVEPRQWRFRLSRADRDGWRIDSVQSR
ncbi:hypothetical protein [Luteitalea sp. TBR-22]|uniref:hypothetical protein n=1 Tax=Luteitalea sp. TBR-22 TaxID=2802971 RepID=UPI001EF59EC8|nr:hypothetical protein [Luteitalea sp. TBR-22]